MRSVVSSCINMKGNLRTLPREINLRNIEIEKKHSREYDRG